MLRLEVRSVGVDVILTASVTALLLLDTRAREQPLFALAALVALAVQVVASRRLDGGARRISEAAAGLVLLMVLAIAPLDDANVAALAVALCVRAVTLWNGTVAFAAPLAILGALTVHGFEHPMDATWIALSLGLAIAALRPGSDGQFSPGEIAQRDHQREVHFAWQRRFISMVSHDIRAPLATIRGAAALLRDHYEHFDAERRNEFLGTLMDGTEHLRILVDDLLLMSQIEHGRLLIERTAVDIAEAMRDASHAVLARDPSRTIDVVAQSNLPRVHADAVRLRQVVTNLLGNALKYSTSNSEVIVVLAEEDGGVRSTIYNEGAGISPEEQAKIFTPYASLSTRSADSVGLGLYIAKELVEAMGGRIGFDSQPGRNAAFWFWLPAATSDRLTSTQYTSVALRPTTSPRNVA